MRLTGLLTQPGVDTTITELIRTGASVKSNIGLQLAYFRFGLLNLAQWNTGLNEITMNFSVDTPTAGYSGMWSIAVTDQAVPIAMNIEPVYEWYAPLGYPLILDDYVRLSLETIGTAVSNIGFYLFEYNLVQVTPPEAAKILAGY